jgi:GWxTD domain-containing protein
MKKYLISLSLCISILFTKQGQGAVTAYLTYAVFETPGQGPYVETYISVIGSSVKLIKNQRSNYQGMVEISMRFLQNNEIKGAKKYVLNGPEIDDSTAVLNFIDQQRFVLPNGDYQLEMTIMDKNVDDPHPFTTTTPIHIDIPFDQVTLSDIQLLESYSRSTTPGILTKSGYDLVPYVSTFYPENIGKLRFYAEAYHTPKIVGEGQKLLISYFIESFDKKIKNTSYTAFTKPVSAEVNAVMGEFNIESLPTGNYNLVIEVRDRENKLLTDKRSFFQRLNKEIPLDQVRLQAIDISNAFVTNYKSKDTLIDCIRSLRPISTTSEIEFAENLLKETKIELLQQYFYNFWMLRNELDPKTAWLNYHKEVLKTNKEFTSFGIKGYDTDRGRVYLQYGPPDQRNTVNSDPSTYPYEIWQYNSLVNKSQLLTNPGNRQSNKRFVFYNPDLVTNRYPLIHSDARGELQDSRWQMLLNKRTVPSFNSDEEKVDDGYGRKVNENYSDPK